MSIIRHVCGGHEYRYDTQTGVVTNNYGREVSQLLFHKFMPAGQVGAALYSIDNKTSGLVQIRANRIPTDEECAVFAIGQTALLLPEPK